MADNLITGHKQSRIWVWLVGGWELILVEGTVREFWLGLEPTIVGIVISLAFVQTCMAQRSEFSECPMRIASEGRISIRAFWTSATDVVTFSNNSLVMPENLKIKSFHFLAIYENFNI